MNPKFGDTDAVTLPLLISNDVNASSVKAFLGILFNPAPLPLKNEPVATLINPPLTNKEPLNCEPLSIEVTLNPSFGETDAVTLPLAILFNSSESAENGILNNPLPSPLYKDADIFPLTNKLPVNLLPTIGDVTTNPKLGVADAVTEPLNIFDVSKSEIAESGISNKFLPLPLNEPLLKNIPAPLTNKLPLKREPLATDVTTNPILGDTDAVTDPDLISVVNKASGVNAVLGILNNLAPLPE